jgi:hypothetical protein
MTMVVMTAVEMVSMMVVMLADEMLVVMLDYLMAE